MILASTFALVALAALIVGLSAWGGLFPADLISFVHGFMRRRGSIVVAVVVRILLAAFLWVTATASHTPIVFKVLAGIALLAAFIIAIAGPERVSRLVVRVGSWREYVIQMHCLPGVAFGVFLIWSVSSVWTTI